MKAKKTTKTQSKNQVPKWVELGEVAIDSGQLVLTDPAYLQGVDGKQFYEQLLSFGDHVEFPGEGGGVLNGARLSNTWGKRYLGLMLPNFGGDGVFPVYGVFEEGELRGAYIALSENRWEGFKDDRITEEEFEALKEGAFDVPSIDSKQQANDPEPGQSISA
jgi:hypothetical protein